MTTPLPQKVIVLGSAALKIGEAGEFDYSGSQAVKALKAEGIETVLINPNIATVQTSEDFADQVYFLPVTVDFVTQVIEKEKPDAILLSCGGQTALNCGLKLEQEGILEKYNVRVLGTPVDVIRATEDRNEFIEKLKEIDTKTPYSVTVTDREDLDQQIDRALSTLSFPIMVRIGFALGGLGSGVSLNEPSLRERAKQALAHTDHILLEEYLEGWKEVEYEVVRDQFDNCVTVCNMENFDPLGIHTGESIVVAPSQTLTNNEYHKLREISIRIVRHLGIIGECNVQFALDSTSDDYRVIEVNARLSRSSALASKATGYPLAWTAAKLSLGQSLVDLRNSVTETTTACFEPSLDYIVIKMPRWDLKKFKRVTTRIGSGMKSVGEVMAIGRSFEETLQKVIRMLELGHDGIDGAPTLDSDEAIRGELQYPTDRRLFAIYEAFRRGFSVEKIHELTHIDRWFLHCIESIYRCETELSTHELDSERLLHAKQHGFADSQIARLTGIDEASVRQMRTDHAIHPVVKQIDTLAAEYPSQTNYLYLTYLGTDDDVAFNTKPAPYLILGSGAYRIGSSVEFDWCSVQAARSLRSLGHRTCLINYNPETVSTDYDECDRLYFDEITVETVGEIARKENPRGVVVSVGGQIANTIARPLEMRGLTILGTSTTSIDRAEDRNKFSSLLDELNVVQPEWIEASSLEEVREFAERVSYPVLVRPSYVLSGAAMAVASNDRELEKYLNAATEISTDHPIVVSKFIQNAKEIEIDAVAKNGEVVVYAICEHVENAGVHSGDATLVLPPQRTYLETIRRVKLISRQIAKALNIHGPFNMQFMAKNNQVYVIECNLRASRSVPFVSKIYRVNFIERAIRVMIGENVPKIDRSFMELDYVGVKAPQFSFTRLIGADPTLGVEMASTGEVGCIGDDFEEAFLKTLLSVGYHVPVRSILLSTGPIESKAKLLPYLRLCSTMGIRLIATEGSAKFLNDNGVEASMAAWPLDAPHTHTPNSIDILRNREVDLVVNIPKNFQEDELTNDYTIRRAAVDYNIPLITNLQLAQRFLEALSRCNREDLKIRSWDEYRTL